MALSLTLPHKSSSLRYPAALTTDRDIHWAEPPLFLPSGFTPHRVATAWPQLGMWSVWVRSGGRIGVLLGKPEGKRPLGRPRRRWVDNISMDLQEVGCGYMDWIGLAQDRDRWWTLVSTVKNLRVP